jgi:Flp pilus assembly protein TadG
MRSHIRSERGSVTAEFAAVLPAAALVLAVTIGAIQLAEEQLRIQAAAATAARSLGRGDAVRLDGVAEISRNPVVATSHQNGLVCVTLSIPAELGVIAGIRLAARSCALDDGG